MNPEEMMLYEYAVIRYMPRIERGEFVNVGLIMMCKRRKWLQTSIHLPMERIRLMKPQHDEKMLMHQLSQFSTIGSGDKSGGEIAELPTEERFRWLTAVRSACIRTSDVHSGLTHDLDQTFRQLLDELVL